MRANCKSYLVASSSYPVGSNHTNLTSVEIAKNHKLVSKAKIDNLRGFKDTPVSNSNPNTNPNPNQIPNVNTSSNPNPNLNANTNPNPNSRNITDTHKFINQDNKVNKLSLGIRKTRKIICFLLM